MRMPCHSRPTHPMRTQSLLFRPELETTVPQVPLAARVSGRQPSLTIHRSPIMHIAKSIQDGSFRIIGVDAPSFGEFEATDGRRLRWALKDGRLREGRNSQGPDKDGDNSDIDFFQT